MKNKLLLLATLIATSIACFAMVDAFDRHSKGAQPESGAAAIETSGTLPARVTTEPQVARLMTGCTGRALAHPETNVAAVAASTVDAGAMACCREEEAAAAVAALDHSCCATPAP